MHRKLDILWSFQLVIFPHFWKPEDSLRVKTYPCIYGHLLYFKASVFFLPTKKKELLIICHKLEGCCWNLASFLTVFPHENFSYVCPWLTGESVGAQSEVRIEPGVTLITECRFTLEGGGTIKGLGLSWEQWSRNFEWGTTHFYTFDEEGRKEGVDHEIRWVVSSTRPQNRSLTDPAGPPL